MPTQKFFCLLLFEGSFTSCFREKSHKKSKFFLLLLLVDRRIRMRTKMTDPGGPKTYQIHNTDVNTNGITMALLTTHIAKLVEWVVSTKERNLRGWPHRCKCTVIGSTLCTLPSGITGKLELVPKTQREKKLRGRVGWYCHFGFLSWGAWGRRGERS